MNEGVPFKRNKKFYLIESPATSEISFGFEIGVSILNAIFAMYRLALSHRFDVLEEVIPKDSSLIFPGKLELVHSGQRLWKWETSWHKAEGCFTKIMFYYYMTHLIVNNHASTKMRIKLLQQTDMTSFMFMKEQLYAGWKADKELKCDNEKDYILLSTKALERTYCLIVNDKNDVMAYRSFDDFKEIMLKICVEDSSILITGDKLVASSSKDSPVTIPKDAVTPKPVVQTPQWDDRRDRWRDCDRINQETFRQDWDDRRIDSFGYDDDSRSGYYHDPRNNRDYIVTKFGDSYCFKPLEDSDDKYARLNLYAETYFKIKPY